MALRSMGLARSLGARPLVGQQALEWSRPEKEDVTYTGGDTGDVETASLGPIHSSTCSPAHCPPTGPGTKQPREVVCLRVFHWEA